MSTHNWDNTLNAGSESTRVCVCINLWVSLLVFVCVWCEAPGARGPGGPGARSSSVTDVLGSLTPPRPPSLGLSERYIVPWNFLVPMNPSCVSRAGRRRAARHINSSTPPAARITCAVSSKCARGVCVCVCVCVCVDGSTQLFCL